METRAIQPLNGTPISSPKPFIQANTQEGSLQELSEKHIIPMFSDSEPAISHGEFIALTRELVQEHYRGETILEPSIRLSHPILGRVPEARHKPAAQLSEEDKTVYFERMAFVIEVPSIFDTIDGAVLTLTVGGVKAYNMDNLRQRKGKTDEHFKIFCGFKVSVCTNLSVWSDGFCGEVKVKSLDQLGSAIRLMLQQYEPAPFLRELEELGHYSLTEEQFAHLVGKCRMYPHLPQHVRRDIAPLQFTDSQIALAVKDYYGDDSFARDEEGRINLWKFYNLLTSSNKSSYIDSFVERSANALEFTREVKRALKGEKESWFLN